MSPRYQRRGPTNACSGAATAALRLLLRPADAWRWAIELKARIDSIDRCSHIC